jgi:HD-like signal output (HDOD) protein/CheY-like chemotaxis protein
MKILILDDEIVSRTKLTLIMEHFGECDAVDNGKDAIARFRAAHHKQDPYELIMLDINLPGMNGIEVLSEIRKIEQGPEIKPERSAKILMATSYRDRDRIIASIQSGCNDYIGKPFDIDIIRKKLAKLGICEPDQPNKSEDSGEASLPAADPLIDSISGVIDRNNVNLPTLPKIRTRFREMIAKGAVSQQLAEMLKKDISISTEIIRSSNSAYYRGFIASKSLEQAISRLGIAATRQLIDELSSREYFSMQNKKYRSLFEKLWKHSIACAYAAEISSYALKLKLKADPFFLGLLHDIGKLALLQILAELEQNGKMNGDFTDQKLINTLTEHHGQFGARVLEKWKYGEIYISSALYHEFLDWPESGESNDEESIPAELLIVNFANHMAKSLGFDLSGKEARQLDLEDFESARRLKLTSNQIEKARQTVSEEMKGVEELF